MEKMITALSAQDAVVQFREMGLTHMADEITQANADANLEAIRWPWNRDPQPWEFPYAYGFIPHDDPSDEITLQNVTTVAPDLSLKGSQVVVSLDRLRVFDFPGSGRHNVLFKFTANNFIEGTEQQLSFNQTFKIQEGQIAPITGYPVFIGLSVGDVVLQFQTEIVNVSNDSDNTLLNVLDSPVFNNGLKLLNKINPIVPVVSEYATGITRMILSRNKNIQIPAPTMGLYFDSISLRPKLAQGSYMAIQMPDPDTFEWNQYSYNRHSGALRRKDRPNEDLRYNYFVFSISKL